MTEPGQNCCLEIGGFSFFFLSISGNLTPSLIIQSKRHIFFEDQIIFSVKWFFSCRLISALRLYC